ncbi:MAG: DNA polymerase III subunit delta [Acidimicrobiales bacterium]
MSKGPPAGSYLVKGDDPSLVAQGVRTLLAEVVGDGDHSLAVEEIGGGPGDELDVGAVVDACMTPPFLIDRRVVVVRDAGRLLTADVPRLLEVITDPLPSTVLILVAGGGTIPAALVKAIETSGRVVSTSVSRAGDRRAWLADHLRQGPVKLEPRAAQLLGQHVGEDLSRVEGLLEALSSAYGAGARISVEDLEPYLGEAGNVPRYELTDAISRGEPSAALGVLHRMLDAGGLSAVEILATMNRHYAQLLALDGAAVSGESEAAVLLGSAPYAAKKALEQARRLGSARIAHAITLLAEADLDVKGATGLPPQMVLEIVVARLSRQTRRSGPGRPVPSSRQTGRSPSGARR